MPANPDFRDLFAALSDAGADFLLVGAHAWGRMVAAALTEQGFRVLLVDTNRSNILAARMEGTTLAWIRSKWGLPWCPT